MATSYIHTCYRILAPARSEDFYVNKLGMKKVGEMDLGSATNHFFAMEEDPASPMLELTHNHDRTEPYDIGDGYAHVAFVVDDLEGTVEGLKDPDRRRQRLQACLYRGPRRLQGRTRPTGDHEGREHDAVELSPREKGRPS